MKLLTALFVSFFKIGLFTFGGGYAMLPMLQREVVEKHHWASDDDILDFYAIAQCTPGIIAVNTATFIGARLKGAVGGCISTLAVISPSIIIITIISQILRNFSSFSIVQHAFVGIRISVCVLVIVSISKLYKKGVKGAMGNTIFAASLLLTFLFQISPIWIVLIASALGVINVRKGHRQK